MITEPDGFEVVGRRADAGGLVIAPLLVLESVERYLDDTAQRVPALAGAGSGAGPLAWQRIGDGQSNITYLMQRGDRRFVLRRGPRPPIQRSTHDMVREARVQRALADTAVPVPTILTVCEDESVLGVPFYLMELVEGSVITTDVPEHLDTPEARYATGLAVVDTMAALHSLDISAGPLSELGRPDGYLRRQVERFTTIWEAMSTRGLPAVSRIGDWLRDRVPETARATVVHGDFRIGNLMFAAGAAPRVVAVLDWEMATLGDPLADLGYFAATYSQPGDPDTPMNLSPVTAEPGFPSRAELVDRYRASTGADVRHLDWYQVLALWKASIFLEDMYVRWRAGEREGDVFAPTLETGVPVLLEVAASTAGIAVGS